ncbi:YtxH domain-containing protein [Alkalicoccus urumqiensis]|uniref:YtxH domain-containing protein n=1 Tax=Alkalicoccus urumqiensis TaxID=1548213 RepID=A0A2P6MGJ6_ALKUR|nr:YtxH domain-containing protein [Alkalicoccus urumqiensis]PRO65406.1 hypothetical protein C6I21_09600 [Alkalicoccus urumqiensis]
MSEANGVSVKDFVTGALAGAMVGASAAFLFAPTSGRRLREGINEQAKESTVTIANNIRRLTRSLRRDMKELKDSADYLLDDFDDVSGDIASSVRQEVEDLQRSVEQLIKEVEEREAAKKGEQTDDDHY